MSTVTIEQPKTFTGKRVDPSTFNKKLYLATVKRASTMSNEAIARYIDSAIDDIAINGADRYADLLEVIAIFAYLLSRRPKNL